MKRLGIDIETYSSRDIKNVGVYAYADAPDFEVMLFAYKEDDDPVKIIDLAQGEELPAEILQALFDPHVLKTAYNANFEMTCLTKWLGREMDPAQWSCTSVLALTLGLPGFLAGVAGALHFPEDKQKMKVGKRLIDYFCKPCKPTKANGMRTRNLPPKRQNAEHAELFTDYCKDGDDWELFKEYCRQDVVVEQEIRDRLERYLPGSKEHRLWELDQRINNGGILVDMTLVDNAIRLDYEIRSAALNDMRRLTGLDNPNSRDQLKPWLEARLDTKIDSLDKQYVEDTLKRTGLPADVRAILKLKQLVSKTSVKKYEAMKEARCSDGRIHGLLQFYGASRTGRWAGRLVQVHNLPQNHLEDLDTARQVVRDGDLDTLRMLYDNPSDVLSQLIRTALVARPGYEFLVADFSAIEARVIAWLAGEKWRLETFAKGGDIYCASASAMFGVPVEKHGQNSHLRQKGKIAELALGYQGSVGALVSMGASRMGIPEKELSEIVTKWRSASPHIVKMWWDAEKAAKQAIDKRKPVPFVRGIVFSVESGILFIRLPGGRRIAYPSPKLVEDEKGKASITYMGTDQTSKGWCRLETYGGKLVENIVQATARDCLADAMLRLDEAGYRIRMHVHDEVIIEAPAGKEKLEDITAIMATNSSWNRGLPLAAAGYVTPYYKKD